MPLPPGEQEILDDIAGDAVSAADSYNQDPNGFGTYWY
jgi:hypothetical protein